MRLTAEIPSIPGSRTSMITTSGWSRSIASSASSPVSAVSTRSRSSVPRNSRVSPWRTVGWSSTARQRVVFAMWVRLMVRPPFRQKPRPHMMPSTRGATPRRRMYDSIVVGTDGSDTAKEAVRQAAELAKTVDAKLHLVSAYEPVPEGRLRQERQQVPDDMQWMVNPKEDVEATLKDAAGELEEQGVQVDTYAREGDPADAILDVAEEQNADLIVVGNKGMTGARRFLLGSVPNKVSHHAPSSVMIIRTT